LWAAIISRAETFRVLGKHTGPTEEGRAGVEAW